MTTCCLRKPERWLASAGTAATQCVLFAVLFASLTAAAEPYHPQSADVVLLRLRAPSIPSADSIESKGARLAAATHEMALGRANLDERHFGRAEALLLRSLECITRTGDRVELGRCDADSQTTRLLIAYADVLQHGHDFANAERALDVVLSRDGASAQARLMRASIRLARGEPRQALADCSRLVPIADSLTATACIAQSISLMGRLTEAVELLTGILEKHQARDAQSAWALGILAELLERQGHAARAIAAIERALSADPGNVALRIQASDLSLRQGRAERATELLAPLPPAEAVVLRRAMAARALRQPQADALREKWRALVATSRQLQSSAHERDIAIGELYLMNRPTVALQFALANWAKSRDIDAARILLFAARAAGQSVAAAPASKWLDAHNVEDAVIDPVRQAGSR
jgi:tetratricopeptide (TPR) repeat protein